MIELILNYKANRSTDRQPTADVDGAVPSLARGIRHRHAPSGGYTFT